ncbi:hypothetical protein ACFY9A_16340 [Streptomyces rubradiris]
MAEQVPLPIGPGESNITYLRTEREWTVRHLPRPDAVVHGS